MASEYRRVVFYLGVWLACIDSIRSVAIDSTPSNSHEQQSEADYIKLQELIRQEIFGLMENDADGPGAGLYAAGKPVGTQVRHLRRGPRRSRWRDLLFGYDDGAQQNGAGGLLSGFRRPPPKNNRVDATYDYYVDGANPEYGPSQNLYPSYDYLPAGNDQMMYDAYDGYGRRPNMMWSGAGVPSDYVYYDQPPRVPARRMGMRPPPGSFSMTGNGRPAPTFDSIGRPGTYLVQVPGRGRRPASSQAVNSGGEGYTVIPFDESGYDRVLNGGAGIPIRVDGKGSEQNAISRLPVPASQSINSEYIGIPDSEVLSTNIDVPRVSGGQPSSQLITLPAGTAESKGSRVQLPVNKNNLRVESEAFPSTDGMNVNTVDVFPDGSESSPIPIRTDAKRNNPNRVSRISVPGAQSIIVPENMDAIDAGGVSNNFKLLPTNGGQSSLPALTIPTSGSVGSRMQLPVSMNDLPIDESGFLNNMDLPVSADGFNIGGSGGSGSRVGNGGYNTDLDTNGFSVGPEVLSRVSGGGYNTDLDTNGFSVGPEGLGFKVGNGGFLTDTELPTSGSGIKIGNNQIAIPVSETLNSGGGGPMSAMSVPMDLSRTPGSFRVTSGGVGQASPTSSSIQGLRGLASVDSDAQPDYDIDMRNLEELSNSPSAIEIPNTDVNQISGAITSTGFSQPLELVDAMPSGIESSMNLVNQGAAMLPMKNEATSLLSDFNPSKMLTVAQDAGKAAVKGMSKNLDAIRPSFMGGKSSKLTVMPMDENAIVPSGNALEVQSNADEQMYASPAESETQMDESKNLKIQAEPMSTNLANFAQNAPEILTANGNAVGPKRRGANQSGSYYIIQPPEDFSDMFGDDVAGNYENQVQPQKSKSVSRNQMRQPTGEMSGVMNFGNGSAGTQSLELGPTQNNAKLGTTRMMSSRAGADGSGAGNSGRQRQYRVLVVDGDHEILRGLRLPGMKPNSGVSSEV